MAKAPYQYLYIYEITGDFTPPTPLAAEDYLGCWREGECSYLFYTAKKEEKLKEHLGSSQLDRYLSETVINYEEWEAGKPLVPVSVAGFHLCPFWEDPNPGPGEHVIRLDPGVAFGSGYHPTTRMCLTLLKDLYDRERLPVVLDLGTGTGILSLACLCRGAERILAVDHNNLAAATAQRNIRHNHREGKVDIICGDAMVYAGEPADLALANIYHGILRELLCQVPFFNKKWYILSGIVGTEVDKILTQMQSTPLEPVQVLDENLWFAILARHREYQG